MYYRPFDVVTTQWNDINPVILKFRFKFIPQKLLINTLTQRTVTGGVKHTVYHLVKQRFLCQITYHLLLLKTNTLSVTLTVAAEDRCFYRLKHYRCQV